MGGRRDALANAAPGRGWGQRGQWGRAAAGSSVHAVPVHAVPHSARRRRPPDGEDVAATPRSERHARLDHEDDDDDEDEDDLGDEEFDRPPRGA